MRRLLTLSALMVILCFSLAFCEETASSPVELYQAPQQLVITFTGDCTLGCTPLNRGRSVSFEAYIEKNGYGYPFENVKEIFENDDLTVINLEGAFYDSDDNAATDKNYLFRGPTDYVNILTESSIEAVSVANNHVLDYGEPGFQSTIETLESQGIAWFGTNECADQTWIFEKDGIKIGFVASYISYWWGTGHGLQARADVAALKEAGCDVIIACLHGGVEYDIRHDSRQEQMADKFIDYGADIVIFHHAHSLMGMRVYNGVTTLWSLGNFSFGGNAELKVTDTYIAQFTLSFDEEGNYLGHQLNILPCYISSTLEYNNYQPILMDAKTSRRVIAALQKDVYPRRLVVQQYQEGIGCLQEFVPVYTPEPIEVE